MNKKIILLIAIITLGGVIAYLSQSKQNSNKLSVGVHSWPGGGIVYIGKEKGFFEEEGIELDIKKIENFDTKRASLVSGQIDIDVANTLDQLLIYNENDFHAQIIGITDESNGGDGIVCDELINDVSQLEGKSIAYAEASPSDFFLRYILKSRNIDLNKVNFKPVADPQIAGNAVMARQVDAAVTYEPWLSQSSKEKGLKILISTKEYPTLIPGLLIADASKVESNRIVYEKFLRAWFKSVEYYYSHKEEALQIIAKGMQMEVNEIREILSVVDIQSKSMNIKLIDKESPNNLYDLLTSINLFWKQNGFIKKSFESDRLLNADLIKQ